MEREIRVLYAAKNKILRTVMSFTEKYEEEPQKEKCQRRGGPCDEYK